jgi:hypothetical protein
MNASKTRFLFLTGALVLLAACAQKNITAREGRLFFAVSEAYPGGKEGIEPSLFLSMETEKIYGCCNFSIEAFFQHVGSLLSVDIRGIHQPDICLTALGPAFWGDFLELEEGVYSLEFLDGFQKNVFEVRVTQDAVTVAGASGAGGGFALPKYTAFWRYPRNSFAVLCGTMDDTAWIYDDFLSRLLAAVELQEIEFPAYGELGYPRAPQGHHIDHPARFFTYAEESDFQAAGEVLRAYVRDVMGQPQGVSIKLHNWKNESFRSWQMAGTAD